MFDAISPSEAEAAPPRARGRVLLTMGAAGLRRLEQESPCRILFPRAAAGEPLQAVLLNTAGGVVGGDRLNYSVRLETGAAALVTGQAAEKIYRSSGEAAAIRNVISVAGDAALEWLPQGSIVFDGARLRRTTEIAVDASGRLLAGEIVTFGRVAMGERFRGGLLHDAWRVRFGGRLAWADALRLTDSRPLLARVGFDGARALATAIYVADGAAGLLEAARDLLERTAGALRAGVTAFENVLLARWMDPEPARVRSAFGAFWSGFRNLALGRPAALPAIWNV